MLPTLKPEKLQVILSFIRQKVDESGASGLVLGVSGGIDSALTLRLCADAIGASRVHALLMPEGGSVGKDETDAIEYARLLGVPLKRIVIGEVVKKFVSEVDVEDRKVIGNIKARTRMVLCYAFANKNRLLVAGTSNKSELLSGYFTKYGDGASDFCPLGDLYKTEVRQLAAFLKLPPVFLEKTPTAGLWPGQSDESEMGLTYEELDAVLYAVESGGKTGSISEMTGVPAEKVGKVLAMVKSSRHKRRPPSIPKLGHRTVGTDWPD